MAGYRVWKECSVCKRRMKRFRIYKKKEMICFVCWYKKIVLMPMNYPEELNEKIEMEKIN